MHSEYPPSKMQLKFVVAKYTIAQNYQSKYAHTLNTIPSFTLPSLSHQVRVSRMFFKQFKFLIKKIVTLFCSNYLFNRQDEHGIALMSISHFNISI